MEQFWISLHLENLDGDIPCIAFCFRVIMMNPGFVSSGNILEEIIPVEMILIKKFLSNSFPVFLHGVSQLSWGPPDANFSVV